MVKQLTEAEYKRGARQGKCIECKQCFRWLGAPKVKDAICPDCSSYLVRTTYQNKWPWMWVRRKKRGDGLLTRDLSSPETRRRLDALAVEISRMFD